MDGRFPGGSWTYPGLGHGARGDDRNGGDENPEGTAPGSGIVTRNYQPKAANRKVKTAGPPGGYARPNSVPAGDRPETLAPDRQPLLGAGFAAIGRVGTFWDANGNDRVQCGDLSMNYPGMEEKNSLPIHRQTVVRTLVTKVNGRIPKEHLFSV